MGSVSQPSTPFAGFWGDGSDGALVFDGTNSFGAGLPAGMGTTSGAGPNLVYTLTRDIFGTTISVSAGKTVNTNGFRIFATVSLTNAGNIQNLGNAAVLTVAGATNGNTANGFVQGTAGGGSSATV